ncbi:eCIS core domain-containing protein [Limnofasciculus baicalensis]|uniref:DUF4157 domain-containing protein n=1 Tax=Limnofasciculus baicalensis BBK-W-15 TaxID=2699891 RepID=A0AAE3GSV1_9CYAN|nr:DUF4157 domain-containing protein [Limnofasciculus baicalensis]MCP2729233.1 DUF4157 domain-containing protein [Limnofasciculus baicalensis BBK-W-15]
MRIPEKLRQQVIFQADYRCEYCKISSRLTGILLLIEHILPCSLEGTDDRQNLAASCYRCNEFKESHFMKHQHLSQTKNAIANHREGEIPSSPTQITRHSPHPILELQSLIGNRAVNQLLAGEPLVQTKPLFRGLSHELAIQPKLTIGSPGDKYEQEADSIAKQVVSQMNGQENSQIQRKQTPEEDEELQMKPIVQRLGEGNSMTAPPELSTSIQQSKSSGQPLANTIRQPMEQAFGADFSGVKVHTDTQSHQLNQSINAQAFTTGQNIFFRQGLYNPGSRGGEELIAHELTHVVQQNGVGNHHTANRSIAQADRSAEANIETITPNSAKSITQNASPSLKRTIQRKIGFEIETGIPITREENLGQYVDPNDAFDATHVLEIPVLGGSKLTPDHIPRHTRDATEDFDDWPIIEFASAPVDETQSIRSFKRIANTWLDLLVNLRSKVSGTPPPKPLSNYVGGAPADIFMGYPGLQTLEDEELDRVVIQATVGARLDRLANPMTAVSTVTTGKTSVWDRAGAAGKAVTNASTLIDNVKAQIPPLTLSTFNLVGKSKQRQQIDELRGFLMLISNYLVAGFDVKSGYIKNRTAWFYKSKLSDVCNDLVASNSYANTVLRGTQAAWVKSEILTVNLRLATDDVFYYAPQVGLDCQTWLDEVFAGTNDQVFENAKNPWSLDIAPDRVKGRLAAVMEMRSPGVNFDPGKMFKLSTDRDDIVDYLAVLYREQRNWQDI